MVLRIIFFPLLHHSWDPYSYHAAVCLHNLSFYIEKQASAVFYAIKKEKTHKPIYLGLTYDDSQSILACGYLTFGSLKLECFSTILFML